MGAFENLKHKATRLLLPVLGAASLSSCADMGAGSTLAGMSMPPVPGRSSYTGYGNQGYGNNDYGRLDNLDKRVAADRVGITQLTREYNAARRAGDYQAADEIQYRMYLAKDQYNQDRRLDSYRDQRERYDDRNHARAQSMPQRLMNSAQRTVESNVRRAVSRGLNDALRGLRF